MSLVAKAFEKALMLHEGQHRKVSKIPFIVHPIEVANILIYLGASEDAICAGFLHDTIEDTDYTLDELKNDFGDDIFDLVVFATDSLKMKGKMSSDEEKDTWMERKKEGLDKIRKSSGDKLMLKFADSLSNLRSLCNEYRVKGDDVWQYFNASKENIIWNYKEKGKIFSEKIDNDLLKREYESLLNELANG